MSKKWTLEKIVKHLNRYADQWNVNKNGKTIIPVIITANADNAPEIERKGIEEPVKFYTEDFIPNALKLWANVSNIKMTNTKINNQNTCYVINTSKIQSSYFYTHHGSYQNDLPVYYIYSIFLLNRYQKLIYEHPWANKNKGEYDFIYQRFLNSITLYNTGLVLDLFFSGNIEDGELNATPYYAQETNKYTILSFNLPAAYAEINKLHFNQYVKGPLLHDIAAIQYRFGPNTEYQNGDTTYQFNADEPFTQCLWDSHGKDLIDLSNHYYGVILDLRGGDNFSSVGQHINEYKKRAVDNLTFAHGVTIENANLTHYDDTVTLNWANNHIVDFGGHDQYRIFDQHFHNSVEQGKVNHHWKKGSGQNIVLDYSGTNEFIFYFSNSQAVLEFIHLENGTLVIRDKTNKTSLDIKKYSPKKHLLSFRLYNKQFLKPATDLDEGVSFDQRAVTHKAMMPDQITKQLKKIETLQIKSAKNKSLFFNILS